MTTITANPRRFSDTMSANRKPTATPAQMRLMGELNRQHIPVFYEYPVRREGEYALNGEEKSYSIDLFVPPDLAVEVDGLSHKTYSAELHDRKKELYLMAKGFRVHRFTNDQVFQELDKVVQEIWGLMSS